MVAQACCSSGGEQIVNRILFGKSEIVDGLCTFSDARAEHVREILHGEVGQILKTGELDGLIGTSEIVSIDAANGAVTVRCDHATAAPRPWIDLILAPPRPRVMKRLLPQLAALGVGRIVLVGAEKVEKAFWGAQLLKEEVYRPLLVDGLMQSGTSAVPKIQIEKNFRRYLSGKLDEEFADSFPRLVAHPYRRRELAPPSNTKLENSKTRKLENSPTPLLAIGPEGGWTDCEVAALEALGFERHSLGSRILRTDTATVALLAQLMPRFDLEGRAEGAPA